MRRLVLIMLLAVLPASAENERKISNKNRNNSQPIAESTQKDAVSLSSSHPSPDSPDQDASRARDKSQDNEVRVTALPGKIAIKSVKDDIDWTILGCTLVLTGVGVIGTFVALKTLGAIEEQARLMGQHRTSFEQLAGAVDRSFALTHRPRIVIRSIVIPELVFLNRTSPMNQWTQVLTGSYTVANTGDLPATITQTIEGTWCEKRLPMGRPDRGQPGRIMSIALAPGESQEISFPNITINAEDAMSLIEGDIFAYFFVKVRYSDGYGLVRETSACRRFESDQGRFSRIRNLDFEYAD